MDTTPAESSREPAALLSYETYVKNLRALWRVDPRLAYVIDDWGEPRDVHVEPSRSGPCTAWVSDAQGRRVYLHSRYDPTDEADRLVAGVQGTDARCYVVFGLGLGHHVLALFAQTQGEAAIVVCEPSLDTIVAAMFTTDLSEVIGSERCTFLTRLDKDEVHHRLEPIGTTMMLGTQFVAHPPSERIASQFHQAARAALTDYVTYARTTLMTVVSNSRITCKNIAYNLPAYLTTPPIDALRDRFAGLPGIIIAAGPSIGRNIDRLAGLRDRAVLIAVQTMLKPLLRRGLRPHFVTSLDFHEVSRSFFDGIDAADLEDVHLIAEPKATWHVIDTYAGMLSLLDNEFARLCLGDELAARDGLKAGATVAHLSYYFADYLGCDPIVFVGQDLAYTDNVFYTPGVALHDTWRPDLNRFNTIEMREWERIIRRRNILRKVKDIHGDDIYTDDMLFTYLEQFQSDFARARARIIDSTEGGARKVGATVMTLAEAEARFCTRPIPPERFAYRRHAPRYDGGRLSAGRRALAERRDDVRLMRERSTECVQVLKELQNLMDRPADFNRRLARVDDLRAQITRQVAACHMVSMMSQLAELRRLNADLRIQADAARGAERARLQLTRDVEFVQSMIEGADRLLELLDEALARFDAAIEGDAQRGASAAPGATA